VTPPPDPLDPLADWLPLDPLAGVPLLADPVLRLAAVPGLLPLQAMATGKLPMMTTTRSLVIRKPWIVPTRL
jgi:hypothetical protein